MAPSFDTLSEQDLHEEEEEEIDFSGKCAASRFVSYSTPIYLPTCGLFLHAPVADLVHPHSTDLKAQYEVRLEEGLDAFVVIDGLPIVPEDSRAKLIKFLLKKLNTVGRTKEDAVYMPLNDEKKSEG